MRRFFAGLLLFLASLLFVLAALTHWARNEVIDTPTFVRTASRIVASKTVKAEITEDITDAVFAQKQVDEALKEGIAEILPPKLATFRESIVAGARQGLAALIGLVVDSKAFEEVVGQTVTVMHRRLVDGRGLTFDLGDAKSFTGLDKAKGLVGQAASLIPDDLAAVKLLDDEQTRQVNTAISVLRGLWKWLSLLGLACLAGALWVSDDRRRTLVAFGVVVAALALLVVTVLAFARGPVLAGSPDQARPVLRVVWDETVPRLLTRLWRIAVLGVAVFAVAALWGRVGLVAALRRTWNAARERLDARLAERAARPALEASATTGGAEAVAAPERVGFRERARIFVETLDAPTHLRAAAVYVAPSLRIWRGVGVAAFAVLLLLWPRATMEVFFGLLAVLVLYLGCLELLMGFAPETAPGFAAAGARAGPAPEAAPAPEAPAPEPPAEAGPAAPPPLDLPYPERIDLLARLGEAKDAGFLTADEFAREKSRVLTA